ncbi:hypothetical protein [Amycolatopsis pithecellobii]|uniref:Uncharacterized protein n=1 Tax=Amycolatopsis pithecellobii TaxID=664692 RepID=A0A6N7Z4H7_9PSEU|nr:hypothetical protein [Amycolatopsis pithecellobii]MTD55244.1 hypothetical protein [Amycolatopsis pithecellobii]
MIVIVAARTDASASALARRWPRDAARVLTADDLASPGWRVSGGNPATDRAVVQGDIVPVHRITGVLTRIPAITEGELPVLAPEDRSYAAGEMTAFLSYWLSSLDCPVLNRPSAAGLCAPGWRSEQWVHTAGKLGLPVRARQRRVPAFDPARPPPHPDRPGEQVTVTVVGDRCAGAEDETLRGWARTLAAAAGVDLLSVVFSRPGPAFVDAHPWVDLHDEDTATAILDHFTAGRRP